MGPIFFSSRFSQFSAKDFALSTNATQKLNNLIYSFKKSRGRNTANCLKAIQSKLYQIVEPKVQLSYKNKTFEYSIRNAKKNNFLPSSQNYVVKIFKNSFKLIYFPDKFLK